MSLYIRSYWPLYDNLLCTRDFILKMIPLTYTINYFCVPDKIMYQKPIQCCWCAWETHIFDTLPVLSSTQPIVPYSRLSKKNRYVPNYSSLVPSLILHKFRWMSIMCCSAHVFRKNICIIFFRPNENNFDYPIYNMFANNVIPNIDMFCPSTSLSVMS